MTVRIMEFNLPRSTLRPLRATDAASIAREISNRNVSRYMSGLPEPYTLHDAGEWVASAMAPQPDTHFGIAVGDEVVGAIGLRQDPRRLAVLEHSAEIGYWLGEPLCNRGIVSEALAALAEWALTERQFVRIHAVVYAPNVASARVLEKVGYEFEGRARAHYFRDGEFIDALLYGKVRLPAPAAAR
jgi:RimJ/RimL family protein N-acetyltransferase